MVRGLVKPKLQLGLDAGEENAIALNLLPLLSSEGLPGQRRHALSTLSATFQLLRVCEAASTNNEIWGPCRSPSPTPNGKRRLQSQPDSAL